MHRSDSGSIVFTPIVGRGTMSAWAATIEAVELRRRFEEDDEFEDDGFSFDDEEDEDNEDEDEEYAEDEEELGPDEEEDVGEDLREDDA
jgi:hypothetical protein